jgi:hypothetical protein
MITTIIILAVGVWAGLKVWKWWRSYKEDEADGTSNWTLEMELLKLGFVAGCGGFAIWLWKTFKFIIQLSMVVLFFGGSLIIVCLMAKFLEGKVLWHLLDTPARFIIIPILLVMIAFVVVMGLMKEVTGGGSK